MATTEKPWTAKELEEIREELDSERDRALADLEIAEHDLQGLLRDAGEGAGDDQADAGASIFGRDYEMSLVANSRDKLDQVEHALERLDDGTYGTLRVLRQPDRQAAAAGRAAGDPVRRLQDEAGAPLIPATPAQRDPIDPADPTPILIDAYR